MNRRLPVVLGLVLMVTLSGCALLTGENLEFSASKVTVSQAAQDTAGYQEVSVESDTQRRSFSVAGQEREVELTNWVASYERELGGATTPAPGTVAVFATPEISVAGQTLNPIGSMSDRELLELVLQQYGGVSEATEEGTRTVTVLGQETTVTTFAATVEYEGQDVDVSIHLTRVKDGGDFVVAVGVHPAVMGSEQAGIDTMFGGIQHASS